MVFPHGFYKIHAKSPCSVKLPFKYDYCKLKKITSESIINLGIIMSVKTENLSFSHEYRCLFLIQISTKTQCFNTPKIFKAHALKHVKLLNLQLCSLLAVQCNSNQSTPSKQQTRLYALFITFCAIETE